MTKRPTLIAFATLVLAALCAPASAQYDRACKDCPAPRPHYDSQEVKKNTRTIDHSRVIETQTVVPVKSRGATKNHLVIHKNTIRHVGTIRHKHTIIEREIRTVRPRAPTVVNFVVHEYRPVRRRWINTDPRPVYVTPEMTPAKDCIYDKGGRCADAPLGVRG
ncbi:MAG: hypothetical protein FJX62_05900 [Alphaproteobacteria bacterium]|nr:hypothetical protein [Alphaproteobacteria bacterium]